MRIEKRHHFLLKKKLSLEQNRGVLLRLPSFCRFDESVQSPSFSSRNFLTSLSSSSKNCNLQQPLRQSYPIFRVSRKILHSLSSDVYSSLSLSSQIRSCHFVSWTPRLDINPHERPLLIASSDIKTRSCLIVSWIIRWHQILEHLFPQFVVRRLVHHFVRKRRSVFFSFIVRLYIFSSRFFISA